MRLLLDTNAFWWWVYEKSRLSPKALDALEKADGVYVSFASFWEIAIKTRLGKLRGTGILESGIQGLSEDGFLPLTIDYRHIMGTMALPMHHRDPFDRLLIAQARAEDLTLVTSDSIFERYGIKRIW